MSAKNWKYLLNAVVVMVLWLGIGVMLNLIFAQRLFWRKDFTRSKKYSLSEYSKRILSNLRYDLELTFYLSQELPRSLRPLRRYCQDLLREYQIYARKYSHRDIRFEIVDPTSRLEELLGKKNSSKGERDEEEYYGHGITQSLVQLMEKKRVPLSAMREKGKDFYYFSSIQLKYMGKTRVVEHIQDPNTFEYRLSQAIDKLIAPVPIKVGLYSPSEILTSENERFGSLVLELKKFYRVENFNLDKETEVPEDVSILLVLATSTVPSSALYQIEKFILRGGRVIFFLNSLDPQNIASGIPEKKWTNFIRSKGLQGLVQNPNFRYRLVLSLREAFFRQIQTGLSDWMAHYGVKLEGAVLSDPGGCVEQLYTSIREAKQSKKIYIPYFVRPRRENISLRYPFLQRAEDLVFFLPSPLASQRGSGVEFTPLIRTTRRAHVLRFRKRKDVWLPQSVVDLSLKPIQDPILGDSELAQVAKPGPKNSFPPGQNRNFPFAALVEGDFLPYFRHGPPWELPYLFSLPKGGEKWLEQKNLKRLQEFFKKNHLYLAPGAKIQMVRPGFWKIFSQKRVYFVFLESLAGRRQLRLYRLEGKNPEEFKPKKSFKVHNSFVVIANTAFLLDSFQTGIIHWTKSKSSPVYPFLLDLLEWISTGEAALWKVSKKVEHIPLRKLSKAEWREVRWRFSLFLPLVVAFVGVVVFVVQKARG
ncbi:MAG: hypothetical protein D6805_01360 [Planctomycetota bacterium]|nr:MAG: hypothetical protein D6805_01360 [Planctomycetota bacterium]